MCKATEYLKELDVLVNNINKEFNILSKKQSEYDTKLSEYYHQIENANFNACEGYKLTKQLQQLLRKRRIVKDELFRLNSLRQTLNIVAMNNSIIKSKKNIEKSKKHSDQYKKNWKYTYTFEEVVYG